MFIVHKSFYFMQLVDQIAPLVQTIGLIWRDITLFIVIMCIILFSFANSFYMLGKN